MLQSDISRRSFLGRIITLGSCILLFTAKPLFDVLNRRLSPADANKPSILQMQPVVGVRYSRAAWNHMRNRIFASRENLVVELPHRGLIFTIEEVPVTLSRDELKKLFDGKRSLDVRRTSDRRSSATILAATERHSGMSFSTA
jgi:hypothetical protein